MQEQSNGREGRRAPWPLVLGRWQVVPLVRQLALLPVA